MSAINPTAADLRQLKKDNARYPDHLVEVPAAEWPAHVPRSSADSVLVKVFRSRQFLVLVYIQHETVTRLSVIRTEWDERARTWREHISWDDLQRLKGEAGYAAECAVELFPPDDNVVNVANMRHLFITPCPVFMWR